MPSFSAPFDLLTTADPAWQKRVRGLAGYATGGECLRPRTRFVGTPFPSTRLFPGTPIRSNWPPPWCTNTAANTPSSSSRTFPTIRRCSRRRTNAWSDALTEALSRGVSSCWPGRHWPGCRSISSDADALSRAVVHGVRAGISGASFASATGSRSRRCRPVMPRFRDPVLLGQLHAPVRSRVPRKARSSSTIWSRSFSGTCCATATAAAWFSSTVSTAA